MGDFGYSKQAILNTLGVTGNLLGDTQSGTLTNKIIDADLNTISDIDDNEIKAAANIAKSKLANLDIGNADVNASAGIVQSKLATLAIGATELSNNAVDSAAIQDDAVTRLKLNDDVMWEYRHNNIRRVPWGLELGHSSTVATGYGSLSGNMSTTGTPAMLTFGGSELVHFTTGATSGNQAGFRANSNITERDQDPSCMFRFKFVTATSIRLFIGWVSQSASFVTLSDPLNVLHGFGFYCNTTDNANYAITHNDGVGTGTKTPITPTTAIDNTTDRYVSLKMDSTNCTVVFDSNTPQTVSTNIPGINTDLSFQCVVETATAGARNVWIYYINGLSSAALDPGNFPTP